MFHVQICVLSLRESCNRLYNHHASRTTASGQARRYQVTHSLDRLPLNGGAILPAGGTATALAASRGQGQGLRRRCGARPANAAAAHARNEGWHWHWPLAGLQLGGKVPTGCRSFPACCPGYPQHCLTQAAPATRLTPVRASQRGAGAVRTQRTQHRCWYVSRLSIKATRSRACPSTHAFSCRSTGAAPAAVAGGLSHTEAGAAGAAAGLRLQRSLASASGVLLQGRHSAHKGAAGCRLAGHRRALRIVPAMLLLQSL
jgi:hypothetical protein